MTGADWHEVETIFAAALELPPAERDALLNARCANRPDVRAEVASLLASHDRVGEFLSAPLREGAGEPATDSDFSGRVMGPFRLIEPIGRGGMGVVYRAERATGEFAQQVAVKVIETPFQSTEMLRQFQTERQILAALRHPHIVTLLDGGVSQDGHPYLAMEFIDGAPITLHAAAHGLSLEERLRLVQRVCAAVQYAHQHAVVHRDLKPANILVTADGVPKVLDFGVAKLLDEPAVRPNGTVTALWRRALTPNYASPEQLRGLPVTTACDVYALGVVLYELLAGARPYDTADLPLDEVLRLVTERDPPRPSAAAVASLPYDGRRARGDLDAIVLKAMSKEPARRYASAQELSEDLGRFLDRQPVIAREPSIGYVLAKAAHRHRAAFIAAAVSVVALVVALGVSLWERHIALVERNRATARFNDVRQIADALIFKIDNAVAPLPGSTPLRQQIVAEALVYLERLNSDPQRDDALSLEMARAYHRIGDVQGNPSVPNLGDRAAALVSYRKALDVLRPLLKTPGGRDAAIEFGRVEISLATVASAAGARDEAIAALTEVTTVADSLVRVRANDEDARRLAGSAEFQAASLAGAPGSLPHWLRAREIFGQLLAEKPDDPDRQRNVALTEKYLGAYYEDQRDYASALAHHRQAQELDDRRLQAGPLNRSAQFDVAIDLSNVAFAEWNTGHLAEAAGHYERSLAMRSKLSESDPDDVLARSRVAYVDSQLARVYADMGQNAKALDHARNAARLGESMAAIDPNHAELFADDLLSLGMAEARVGQTAAACEAYVRAERVLSTLESNPGLDPDLADRVHRMVDEVKRRVSGCKTAPR